MSFDPKAHLIRVQGGQMYLPVAWRLVWFREQHPEWGIATEAVEINHEQKYAIFRASIFNENGRLIATATKREDVRGFGDYIEKAETSSVGRALAMCGYGTQFCGSEFDESERLADAPQSPAQPAKLHKPDAAQYQQRPNAPQAPQRRYDAPMSNLPRCR